MSERLPSSEPEKRPSVDAPKAPVRAPAHPATTSDFERFPEKIEPPELTSLVHDGNTVPFPPGYVPPRSGPPTPASGLPSFDPQIELRERLGAGGMGEVFLGLQKHLGRDVAVKRIRDWEGDPGAKDRFVHEAKAQSRLQHPGIAQVYDLRETAGSLYLIMEYVPGTTLQDVLKKEKKLSPERIVAIGIQLTEALEAAAHEGYIHRDLKPANVMLTESGKAKIIDFGLALRFQNLLRTRFTEKGAVIGTPAYMSPEQLNEDEQLDIRSDIWALGVLLYALATGEPPFTGRDFVCTVKNVMLTEPAPLTELEQGFPTRLWEVIRKALEKDREKRWQDYGAFREALQTSIPDGEVPPKAAGPHVARPAEGHLEAAAKTGPSRRLAVVATVATFGLLAAFLILREVIPFPHSAPKASADKLAESPEKALAADVAPAKDASPAPPREPAKPPASDAPAPAPAKDSSPKPPTLREKLLGYPLSEAEAAFVEDVLGLFGKHRSALLEKRFESILADLSTLEKEALGLSPGAAASPEKEYRAAQLRAAIRMAELAKGALEARLGELIGSKEDVSLAIVDPANGEEKVLVGRVTGRKGELLSVEGQPGALARVPLAHIRPESLRSQTAPAVATLAFLAMTGTSEKGFRELADLAETRDDLVFTLPIAVRLARLDVEAMAARTAAAHKAGAAPAGVPLGALVGLLKDRRSAILRLFPHVRADFDRVEREETALRLLLRDAYPDVMALGPGTGAFPVAAGTVLARFETDLGADAEELHARTGWHAYGWKLFPAEPTLKEQERYWDLDPDGNGSILRASGSERRLVMGRGAKCAPQGLIATVGFLPQDGEKAAHWRLFLRSREGAQTYLRFDRDTCTLARTQLEAGVADLVLARASLPPAASAEAERRLTLLPAPGNLHVFLDGRPVLAAPEAQASIPQQLSIAVTHGSLTIRSVRVKKSPTHEDSER